MKKYTNSKTSNMIIHSATEYLNIEHIIAKPVLMGYEIFLVIPFAIFEFRLASIRKIRRSDTRNI